LKKIIIVAILSFFSLGLYDLSFAFGKPELNYVRYSVEALGSGQNAGSHGAGSFALFCQNKETNQLFWAYGYATSERAKNHAKAEALVEAAMRLNTRIIIHGYWENTDFKLKYIQALGKMVYLK